MTKAAQLVSSLREGWQSTEDLQSLLFWQPTTIRGAISAAAKKNGLKIERRRIHGVTSYRVAEESPPA